MLGVQTLVLDKIRKMERGSIFFIDDFIDLGSPGSVRLSLMELKKQGLILRPARGIYCYPEIMNEYSGFIMPSPETIAAALGIPCFAFSHQEGHIAAGILILLFIYLL